MIEKVKSWFDLEGPFMLFTKKLGWVMLLNFVFLLTSIPIVTIGASATAMYTVLYKMIQEREFRFLKDYFKAFTQNFVQSTIFWIPMLVIMLVFSINLYYVFNGMTGVFAKVMQAGTILLAVIFCMFADAVFPLIAKFELTSKEVFFLIPQIVFKHIFLSLESVVFTVVFIGGAALLLANWGGILGIFIYFPILACGLHAFMQSYLYDKMFLEYTEQEETDPDYVTE